MELRSRRYAEDLPLLARVGAVAEADAATAPATRNSGERWREDPTDPATRGETRPTGRRSMIWFVGESSYRVSATVLWAVGSVVVGFVRRGWGVVSSRCCDEVTTR